jgi:hypothetical protein
VWRIYNAAGPYPTSWNTFRAYGPTKSRFDHHLDPPRVQNRSIVYGAERHFTCFAEAFQYARTIDRLRHNPWLVAFSLVRDLTLLDLSGTWPTKAGASMAINTGQRARARRWSRAIYAAYPKLQGLLYSSSMDGNRPAVALYERARSAVPAKPMFNRALSDPALLPLITAAAREFGYALV